MNWRARIIEGLLIIIAVAVTARVVWGLLGSITAPLLVLLVLVLLIFRFIGGPRPRH